MGSFLNSVFMLDCNICLLMLACVIALFMYTTHVAERIIVVLDACICDSDYVFSYFLQTFFLRYAGDNSFVCKRAKNCEITVYSRTHCKFCRMMKCLDVGMCRKGRGNYVCIVFTDLYECTSMYVLLVEVTAYKCRWIWERVLVMCASSSVPPLCVLVYRHACEPAIKPQVQQLVYVIFVFVLSRPCECMCVVYVYIRALSIW